MKKRTQSCLTEVWKSHCHALWSALWHPTLRRRKQEDGKFEVVWLFSKKKKQTTTTKTEKETNKHWDIAQEYSIAYHAQSYKALDSTFSNECIHICAHIHTNKHTHTQTQSSGELVKAEAERSCQFISIQQLPFQDAWWHISSAKCAIIPLSDLR